MKLSSMKKKMCVCAERGKDGTTAHSPNLIAQEFHFITDTKFQIVSCENHLDNYRESAVWKEHDSSS